MAAVTDDATARANDVVATFRARGLTLATAESCTGGLVAACLTEIAGASQVFDRGFVTYSNEAKTELLGVPPALIAEHGAVSEAVARAMAEGTLRHSPADVAVAVTGIAGPAGGSPDKPVGLVFIGAARRGGPARVERHRFEGNRTAIRRHAAAAALTLALSIATA